VFILERESIVAAPLPDVFAFFSDPRNLARITSPAMHFRIREAPNRPLRAGDRIRYTIRLLGIPIGWTTRITAWDERRSFSDTQEKGPYKSWYHTHRFREIPGGVAMTDRVEYELPFGPIGRLANALWVRSELGGIFDFREKAIGRIFGPPAR
jgi:ligand-binding SRPBCC domain-containing protein